MQKYTFQDEGSYALRIENINGSGESDGISIPMRVTRVSAGHICVDSSNPLIDGDRNKHKKNTC